MGLTKQYLRYASYGVFNLIGSHRSNIVYIEKPQSKLCAVGACENVLIWDLRKGEKVATLYGDKHEVTVLASSPDRKHLAVGYSDGTVKIFNLASGDVVVTFSGHKTTVSALNYDKDGMRLVSGSHDTAVIVWDVVSESGLFRLKGHKGMITQARFLSKKNVLISSSKDTFVKFWDLDTQHCFKTIVNHITEVWDFTVFQDDTRLVTGSTDTELRFWDLSYHFDSEGGPAKKRKLTAQNTHGEATDESDEETDELQIIRCTKLGSLHRHGKGRVIGLSLDLTGRKLCCHGNDSHLEIFHVSSEEEVEKSVRKKQKKARKRAREEGAESVSDVERHLEDEVRRQGMVKLSSKIKSFDVTLDQGTEAKIVCLLSNNSLESCAVDVSDRKAEILSSAKLTIPAHRTDVRTVSFSSDNTALLSASGETVKIWNRATMQCIRTMVCDYALCSVFAPGDRHIVLGTKTGKLQIFDIASATLLESIEAHTGAVWSICLASDKRSIVSGSADHDVKFWDFELTTDEGSTSKRLTLAHTRTLKMSEDVLCVKLSSDGRFVAVSLLDNTVKVFFADTLKFFLSLYGHKLPVLCMDISTDGTLLVTGSADRNCKLWGLDFGDCHKSIFAHDDSIMCLSFVPRTHMFFTGGKDGKIKEWDGDSFEHIQTLEGHQAEVWCLSVSPSGNYVVSASHDKSLRLWEKSSEPLVLDEEREMERERADEESAVKEGEAVIPGEDRKSSEVAIATKKTVETVKAAERIMEAVELYKDESLKMMLHEKECKDSGRQIPAPALHPMFQAYKVTSPLKYMLEVMKKVKSSELEESLLVLPFSVVTELLKVLHHFIEQGWEVELSCRCLFFLLRIHQGQITSNQVLMPIIENLKHCTMPKVTELKDVLGFNMAAMKFLKQQLEEKESVKFFADASDAFKVKKKKEKKRAILTIKT